MAAELITNATGLLAPHHAPKDTAPTSNNKSDEDGRHSNDKDRVILHLDYDCFYASVFENAEPALLRARPLGVQQKSILATCNYAARARGVRKLMPVAEALRACPDLALRNGEDLAPFRAASRRLWSALRSRLGSAWNIPVERLGLDEVFVDATDAVEYNAALLNRNDLRHSFFQLDPGDPEKGFAFDATAFYGHVYPPPLASSSPDGGREGSADTPAQQQRLDVDDPAQVRLMLGSHLAGHLRVRLESEHGHTSSGGVATNKVLAKLAGSAHKPRDQTTLLPGPAGVQAFLDPLPIRKIPGVGFRTAALIEESMTKQPGGQQSANDEESGDPTVRAVLAHPCTSSAAALSRILEHGNQQQRRATLERGAGARIWALLHGIDDTPVRATGAVPTQLGVEDTYAARPLRSGAEVLRELRALAASLVSRMRGELLVDDEGPLDAPRNNTNNNKNKDGEGGSRGKGQRWIARPRTIRLSTRAHPGSSTSTTSNPSGAFARKSRSQPLPSLVFDPSTAPAEIAERLVQGTLLPLFRRLHPQPGGYNLALLNVSVTNMVIVAGAEGGGGGGGGIGGGVGGAGGRDISRMFRTQEQKLREWTVYDTGNSSNGGPVNADSGTVDSRAAAADLERAENQQRTETPEEEEETTHFDTTPSPREEEEPWDGRDEEVWDDGEEELLDGDGNGDDGSAGGGSAQKCPLCGCALPIFAMAAHERFHAMGG